jgi:hypothetical protein
MDRPPCTTMNQTVPSFYAYYATLDGNTYPIIGHQVPVGLEPVLIY